MDVTVSKKLLDQILTEIIAYNGSSATDKFDSLRAVDAKVRELGLVLRNLPGDSNNLINAFEQDNDFQANIVVYG
ncbi:hypothetical protein [Gorillibacterium massiliense]|uniref:hypothetical protein n=1 Tax=Gorillibacterium massiliense TaxID=1280390 RepID=UPI000594AFE4|nr:hypothetical protein [Gorillibacterium massiliense]